MSRSSESAEVESVWVIELRVFELGGKMTNLEFKTQLERRTKEFAVAAFKYLDALPKKVSTRVIAYQLGKSASSIGANYREANRGESREDFGHKLQIALKEASETCYWLEVLSDLYPTHETARKLLSEGVELRNLFQSISQTTRTRKLKHFSDLTAVKMVMGTAKG